jgi:hypothetical protein
LTLNLTPCKSWSFGGDKNPEFFERRVILNKPESGFISTNYIGAPALAPTFFTKIILRQGIIALTKGLHDQLPIFHFGEKIIPFFVRLGDITIRHKPGSP